MKTIGTVVGITEEKATISFSREGSACESCGACGHFRLFPVGTSVRFSLSSNGLELSTGDQVVLSAPDRYYYMALFLVFIAPLAVLILTAALLTPFASEGLAIAGGFSAFFIYIFLVLKLVDSYFANIFTLSGKAEPFCNTGDSDEIAD